MKHRLIGWFLLIICVLLSLSLVRSVRRWSDRREIIENAQQKLDKVKNENEALTRELAKTQTPEFIEKQAREKLNMAKEGETVVILPQINPTLSPTPTPIDTSANWEKWVKVFL